MQIEFLFDEFPILGSPSKCGFPFVFGGLPYFDLNDELLVEMCISIPIGSMCDANIWGILMGSMLPYIAYMDPMGFVYQSRGPVKK